MYKIALLIFFFFLSLAFVGFEWKRCVWVHTWSENWKALLSIFFVVVFKCGIVDKDFILYQLFLFLIFGWINFSLALCAAWDGKGRKSCCHLSFLYYSFWGMFTLWKWHTVLKKRICCIFFFLLNWETCWCSVGFENIKFKNLYWDENRTKQQKMFNSLAV